MLEIWVIIEDNFTNCKGKSGFHWVSMYQFWKSPSSATVTESGEDFCSDLEELKLFLKGLEWNKWKVTVL